MAKQSDETPERELTMQERFQSIIMGLSKLQDREIPQAYTDTMKEIDDLVWTVVDDTD
jgi:hypothetical protein